MVKKLLKVTVVICLLLMATSQIFGQDMPPLPGEEIIGGLDAPRAIAFGEDGNLYIAVAGSGGEVVATLPGPEGVSEVGMGMTGRIISIDADGNTSDVILGLPSYASEMETIGIYRVIPQGDSLWLIFSGTGSGSFGHFWSDSIVEIDAETQRTKTVINLNDYETANDPDGLGYDTNVADIAWGADGTMYIVDAGANALLSWTADAGLDTVVSWGNVVPTAIEIADNGDIYIGFLGEGLAPGAGMVEHWSGGELVASFGGMTAISDILLDGDTLYAVELLNFGDEGPGPGRVVMVTEDGPVAVAEGLLAPFGLAKGPDGALYVSYGTIAFAPGMTGGVVKLDM